MGYRIHIRYQTRVYKDDLYYLVWHMQHWLIYSLRIYFYVPIQNRRIWCGWPNVLHRSTRCRMLICLPSKSTSSQRSPRISHTLSPQKAAIAKTGRIIPADRPSNSPPKKIMSFAGHSSITVTFDTYGHLFPDPENDQAAFEEIEAGVLGL